MDLDDLSTAHAPRPVTTATVTRDLSEADLQLLTLPRPTGAPLKRIRDSHHALARILSTGVSLQEASMITGYSEGRISLLRADPSFQELVSHYHANQGIAMAHLGDRMAQLSMEAINTLMERLANDPESFGSSELRKMIESFADRTGFGPKTTQVNVNLDLADRLNRARLRAGIKTEDQKTLELQPNPPS